VDSLEKQVEQEIAKVIRISAATMPEGKSEQPDDDNRWTPNDAIEPPENLDRLAQLTQISPVRRSCIKAITLNSIGLGVSIVPRVGMEDEAEDGEPQRALDLLNDCARRDVRSGSPTFSKLIQRVKWDEQEVGNGYLEVSRNRVTGRIDGLFHAPGKRVRRLRDRSGWVVGTRSATIADRVRFDNFGDKVQYDDEGLPMGVLQSGNGKRWNRNELIAFQLYTSESRDYGLPPDVQLAWDFLGDKNAAETNLGFFDGQGVPPTTFFISVEPEDSNGNKQTVQISQKTVKAIADTMRSSDNKNKRVAIVPIPSGAKVQREDMTRVSDRDVGFVAFRADNRRRTLGAWRISPIFVADIEDAGKYTADVERAITKEQVFDPEQEAWEEQLSDTLLRDLGFPHLRFSFKDIEIETDTTRRQAANDAASYNVITRGEYRERQGFPPMPEADEGQEPEPGQVPYGWNAELIDSSSASTPDALGIQRGAEAAASLLAEAQAAGGLAAGSIGVE
jgi:capsid portal protein